MVGAKNVVSLEAWRRYGFETFDHSVERARDLGSLVFLSMDCEFPCHRLPLAIAEQLESGSWIAAVSIPILHLWRRERIRA
jgi:hypothetical protein